MEAARDASPPCAHISAGTPINTRPAARLCTRMLRFLRRLILHIELRRLQTLLPLEPRREARFERAAHEQRPLDRIRSLPRREQFFDLAHETSRIRDIRHR